MEGFQIWTVDDSIKAAVKNRAQELLRCCDAAPRLPSVSLSGLRGPCGRLLHAGAYTGPRSIRDVGRVLGLWGIRMYRVGIRSGGGALLVIGVRGLGFGFCFGVMLSFELWVSS